MRFTRTVTAGALLIALSLNSYASARPTSSNAVAIVSYKLASKSTITDADSNDIPFSSYDVWNKRALPKFGDDGGVFGGVEAGEGSSGIGGIEGSTTDGSSDSGVTAEIGGVGGDGTSDSGAGGAAVNAGGSPSEDGSVDSSSSGGSKSSSDDQFPQGPVNQPVVDIVSRGYKSTGLIVDSDKTTVRIQAPSVGGDLNVLDIDTNVDSVGVKWAINDLDTIENNPGKVPLRTILADSWQSYGGLKGKNMGDLKSINYQTVINENMQKAFPLAYRAAGQTFIPGVRTPLTVTADTVEGSAYSILMDTVFGNGAQKMIAETAGLEGRTVYSIDLFPSAPNDRFDIQFNF